MKKTYLDAEEKEVIESLERGEWSSVSNFKSKKKLAEKAAENFFKKEARINIRLSKHDLELIKHKAAYEGLPYQTLIASILHKYAAGHLDR
jgi:predicted DNA binding CopG/RHH family protein